MLEFEKYKNEIIESIENVELQQEKTNELLSKFTEENIKNDEKKENNDEDLEAEEEIELAEEETELEEEEEIELEEKTEIEILIEQNEVLIEQLEELNHNLVESSWTISIVIVIALGFYYLINQFSKW